MSRQIGEVDYYSVYDFQKWEVTDFLKTQRTDEFNGWQVFTAFFVHPDGPKVSNDFWMLTSHEFAHKGWYQWASVKTMNSAFFDDSIKFYANFYFSNWKDLKVFTGAHVDYRRCVAKAFVKRWPDEYENSLAFLRTEFEEFTKYVEIYFDYEGKKWIDEQKSSILSELSGIPGEIQLTDPSEVYFPDKNSEITAAYTCYRTYDGWFGYVFKPYCENPIKKERDTWMYYDGHKYIPVEYVSKYVDSIPDKTSVAQATEQYIDDLDSGNLSIEAFKENCLILVEFYKFRELLMEITQVDQEESYYSYHCDRYLNTELEKIMDWLDAIYECFSRINSYVDNIQDSELRNNFYKVFGWTYSVIEQLYPAMIEAIKSFFYNDKEGWYPGCQGEEYVSDRHVLWLELLSIFYATDNANTFLVSIKDYFARGLKYMKLPTASRDLVLHTQGEEEGLKEITMTWNTTLNLNIYGFTDSDTYYWIEEQAVNQTALALIIRWFVGNYSMNGIPIIGNLLTDTATEAAQIGQNVKPIFLLKADWDVLKPWLGDEYENDPTNMLELFRNWSISLDSDIYTDQNISALYDFYRKKDVDHRLRWVCTNNYTSYQVRTKPGMPDYVLKSRIADSNNLLLVIGGTHKEITKPQTLGEFVNLADLNSDSYISEITDKKFYVTGTDNGEWLNKMIAFKVNNVLFPILEVSTEGLLVDVPDMPEVSKMTRELYENWLRECQLIDLTLSTTLKMYADYCVQGLISIKVDSVQYPIYGCECYTAQAISNIIALANKLVTNEQKMKQSFTDALISDLRDKYLEMYGNPINPEDYFRRVSLNRLTYNQGIISYNAAYTIRITEITDEIPHILNGDSYYENAPSSLLNSQERNTYWGTLRGFLIGLIDEMTAIPMYITDIRQYEKYSITFKWIQKFRLVNEDSDTIAMLHNKLNRDTPGIESIIASLGETYEIN